MPRLAAAAAALLVSLGLAACESLPEIPGLANESASLPADLYSGAGDPMRQAVNHASMAFASASNLAGRPAEAALAVAEMEYLRVEVMYNPRTAGGGTTASTIFPAAQREWRGALGIAASAPPQAVINGLMGAARALAAGQDGAAAAALTSPIFSLGATGTLQRLAAMPSLPLSNQAAQEATRVLRRGGLGRF